MSRESRMSPGPVRSVLVSTLVALLLATSGCAMSPELPTVSATEASATTNEIADATVATIEATVIAETEFRADDSEQCSGTDVDPDGSIRQWVVNRHVLLAGGSSSAATTAASLAALEEAGWEAGSVSTIPDSGVRHRLTNSAHAGYVLTVTEADPSIHPTVVIVQVSSPCGEFID